MANERACDDEQGKALLMREPEEALRTAVRAERTVPFSTRRLRSEVHAAC
jgi:hypothetical protein